MNKRPSDRGYVVIVHEEDSSAAVRSGLDSAAAFVLAAQLRREGKRVSVNHVVGSKSGAVVGVDDPIPE